MYSSQLFMRCISWSHCWHYSLPSRYNQNVFSLFLWSDRSKLVVCKPPSPLYESNQSPLCSMDSCQPSQGVFPPRQPIGASMNTWRRHYRLMSQIPVIFLSSICYLLVVVCSLSSPLYSIADVVTVAVRNPFELLKNTMQVGSYKSTLSALGNIYRVFPSASIADLRRSTEFEAISWDICRYYSEKSPLIASKYGLISWVISPL